MSGVKIGIGFGQWKYGLPEPASLCHYAEAAEAVGLDSLWLSDHIVTRNPTLDITCLFAMIAARTKRLKMGPSVLTLPTARVALVGALGGGRAEAAAETRRRSLAVRSFGSESPRRPAVLRAVRPAEQHSGSWTSHVRNRQRASEVMRCSAAPARRWARLLLGAAPRRLSLDPDTPWQLEPSTALN